jgi:hypothetical protein
MSRGKGRRNLELIDACHRILEEIQPASVRAVCYRLFVEGYIASMAKSETNRVSRQLTDAREAGTIPFEWVVDETRSVEVVPTWADPGDFAKTITRSYRRNKWDAQPGRIEVWSEKGTVRGTLKQVLDEYEVPFRVMHGYASATAVQDVVLTAIRDTNTLTVLYVGDWDPSGLHMSEQDLPHRLKKYMHEELRRDVITTAMRVRPRAVKIVRVALTAEDVEAPSLPSFDADTKRGDPRWREYVERYGDKCWELDALSPVVLRERVDAAIMSRLDVDAWNRYVDAERLELESITAIVKTWQGLAEVAG